MHKLRKLCLRRYRCSKNKKLYFGIEFKVWQYIGAFFMFTSACFARSLLMRHFTPSYVIEMSSFRHHSQMSI